MSEYPELPTSTPSPIQTFEGLVRRVEQQAARTPDAVAITADGVATTYGELNRRANRLAHRLRALGVGPESLVAVGMDRSAELVVALLGILKSGGAYLPIDLAYPRERLEFVLEDARPAVVLTTAALRGQLPACDAPTLELDPEWRAFANESSADPEPVTEAAHLAYVIYTSGSTGKPKGCLVTHANVMRLFTATDAWFHFGPQDVWTFFHSHAFDFSVWEIWGALIHGGRVVVVPYAVSRSPEAFHALLVRERVTVLNQTPSAFRNLIRADAASGIEASALSLRYVVFGGEALELQMLRPWFERHGDVRPQLINMYGITETTVHVTYRPIALADLERNAGSVIGRPIPDLQLHVLDAARQPVPVGEVGEIYVGGAGVARGYLNRPELTAERFIDWQSPQGESLRLYRSGDLARPLEGGDLEYLGRSDHQVKIRGFRIETGEIESALMRHEGVRGCAVIARTDGAGGDARLVAYVVPAGQAVPHPALRAHLGGLLPEFMVPSAFVDMAELPLTENGKLDRAALPAPGHSRPELATDFEPAANGNESTLCRLFQDVLGIEPVGRHDNFFELGGSSMLAVQLVERIRRGADDGLDRLSGATAIATPVLFQNPTPAGLAQALSGEVNGTVRQRRGRREAVAEPIAIIGMAGRFPGAEDVESFWRNLCDGRDTITRFGPDGLDPAVGPERHDPAYVAARGVIEGVEQFDAAFFGISPKEAELMDPQQRIFLELAWECLERGGHAPGAQDGPVGVFAGMYSTNYFQKHVSAHPDRVEKVGAFQVMLGNDKDYIATRVAHKLDLTGPAISVHTACSTSLVAICQAVRSLRYGDCDMALAGGVAVTCPPRSGYLYQEGAMLSPDGRTRTFDANAQGTVFSDGAAVVLLKRLSDALADGDTVHALIRGTALNNDGAGKASFTAPSSAGQAAVVAMAHEDAGVDPRTIGYVEAHGTATPLGDPIEIEGLTRAFRRGTADTGFCRIGSVKSNVGHLVAAAGATGVIKTALALSERHIPATLHFDAANPTIDFANSPFVVNAEAVEWPAQATPRRAGVSSFGVGGTNAHVVMEEAPEQAASDPVEGPQLLVLSARTPAALERAASRLADHLEAERDANLADVAWTLAVGRKAFNQRIAIVADDAAGAVARLREAQAAAARNRPARASDVVFMFPGQGAQYAGMGRALHAAEPAFREAFDACAEVLDPLLGFDLRERVFGDDPDALLPTSVTQPATFAIEYALARLWMSLGVQPAAMIGHSVGEFVAATLAGVFSLPEALRLVARRGALMQAQPPGAMLSVRMPLESLLERLPSTLSLAAENAPGTCVVAGAAADVASFQARLEADGVGCRALRTSHAFHSAMMEPVVAPFLAEVAATTRGAPRIPLVSTATGDWLDEATAMSAEYWARHLREPVRFAPALAKLLDRSSRVLLEVGPRATLASLARQHPATRAQQISSVATLADAPEHERSALRQAAGELWARGVSIDPAVFDRRRNRRRVRLPTYPFERSRYWVDAAPSIAAPQQPVTVENAAPENSMSNLASSNPSSAALGAAPVGAASNRAARLVDELREVIEDVSGFDLADASADESFLEIGLDSLMLTQVAMQLQRSFSAKVTFRQLMNEAGSLGRLAAVLDASMPAEAPAASEQVTPAPLNAQAAAASAPLPTAPSAAAAAAPMAAPMFATVSAPVAGGDWVQGVISQQMQLMSQQLALLAGAPQAALAVAPSAPSPAASTGAAISTPAAPSSSGSGPASGQASAPVSPAAAEPAPAANDEEAALAHTKYDVAKAFGAIARIHNTQAELTGRQRARLDAFMRRYIERTRKSKEYTQEHRAHLADPRVVNGFRPLLKEITYQIVVERSKGSRMWDIDGHEYIDVLSGFGMNMFGWQPDFVLDAVKQQLELGYEIGPQHPMAGDVAKLACEITGFERAGLCNTGSEAVMGAIRVARTVTGRQTLVIFSGSYHGIFDEVIVRGTKKLKSVPAAPGILRNVAEHVLVLDYGTPETLQIIRERAHEIAAVLVEPVQSRRPDFQPREFLQEVRTITRDAGALLIFDEVVTGFRAHPRGTQGLFGIEADLATYGKVVGGGFPIGIICGKREYMDALDGGHWQFGDDSIPTVGVTYFAGTFVRHPLALAAAKAVLEHLRDRGPALQQRLNDLTEKMAGEINAFCREVGAPIEVRHFASVWKTFFTEDHPMQDLLFPMMRSRGIHILDHFPCFLTTAHTEADLQAVVKAFKESVLELQEAEFLPKRREAERKAFDPTRPPVPGARLGRDPDGQPAWFVANPESPNKYMKVTA